ncbi:MAG TPA: SET domain-containing protein-lysine N-methyltransferase [Puia sp.]|jgi:hypothetical protein|nr:SET domain-containing protein-lysine N-methyltransferase [Puia sp.]
MLSFLRKRRLSGAAGIELWQCPQYGRRIFAIRRFRRGEVIERAPLVRIAADQKEALMATSLYGYYFIASNCDDLAIGLGYTSLYGHSGAANAACRIILEKGQVILRAHRDIKAAEEITINYNGTPDDQSPILASPRERFEETFACRIDSSHLYVGATPKKGRGVFTSRFIPKGEVIEACPFITLSGNDYGYVGGTLLANYTFELDKAARECALVLGFGSLYNHARQANAVYYVDMGNGSMLFYAEEDIPAGQEICINYGGKTGEEAATWFDSRNIVCE